MIHWVVSGKNQTNNTYVKQHVIMKGNRCPLGICPAEVINTSAPTENRTRYWSVPTDWDDINNNTIPAEGEDVHILSSWNMVMDMNPTPVYKLVRVNGNLTFNPANDTELRAKHVYVRAGQLNIGTKEFPYQHTARVTLFGEKNIEAIVYDNAIEAGNKLIANVGQVKMFGKARTKYMTRLTVPAEKDSDTIYVELGLDLVPGDRIALMPTAY